jgi:hypothetical protein
MIPWRNAPKESRHCKRAKKSKAQETYCRRWRKANAQKSSKQRRRNAQRKGMKREGKGASDRRKRKGRGRLTLEQPLPLSSLGASDASCCLKREREGEEGTRGREQVRKVRDERKREGTKRKQGREGGNDSREALRHGYSVMLVQVGRGLTLALDLALGEKSCIPS